MEAASSNAALSAPGRDPTPNPTVLGRIMDAALIPRDGVPAATATEATAAAAASRESAPAPTTNHVVAGGASADTSTQLVTPGLAMKKRLPSPARAEGMSLFLDKTPQRVPERPSGSGSAPVITETRAPGPGQPRLLLSRGAPPKKSSALDTTTRLPASTTNPSAQNSDPATGTTEKIDVHSTPVAEGRHRPQAGIVHGKPISGRQLSSQASSKIVGGPTPKTVAVAKTAPTSKDAQKSAHVMPTAAPSIGASSAKPPQPEEEPVGKVTGRWDDKEHAAFLEGLRRFGRDWKYIACRFMNVQLFLAALAYEPFIVHHLTCV